GGVLWFSTNFRRFKLAETSLEASSIEDVSRETLPEDFPDPRTRHCWRMVRGRGPLKSISRPVESKRRGDPRDSTSPLRIRVWAGRCTLALAPERRRARGRTLSLGDFGRTCRDRPNAAAGCQCGPVVL